MASFSSEEKEVLSFLLGYTSSLYSFEEKLKAKEYTQTVIDQVLKLVTEIEELDELILSSRQDYQAIKVESIELNMGFREGLKQEAADKLDLISVTLGIPILFNKYRSPNPNGGTSTLGSYFAMQIR